MSKRKSTTTSTRNAFESIYQSGGKTNRSNQQLEKCNICLVELTKRDKREKHDDIICKGFIESTLSLTDQNEWIIQLDKLDMFNTPFLLNKHILYTASVRQIGKDKLKDDNLSGKSNDNLILLSPELMQHCNISDGQHVLVLYLGASNRIQRHYLEAHSYQHSKGTLSVDFLKDSPPAQRLYMKDGTNQSILRIDFQLSTLMLKSLNLQIEQKFADPFKYLTICCTLKEELIHKVIDPTESHIKIEIGESQHRILVKQAVPNKLDQLENSFVDLSLTEKEKSPPPPGFVYVINENTEIIFSSNESLTIPSNELRMVGYSKQMKLLEKLILKPLKSKNNINNTSLPRTILLTGPSGTGKSLAMREIFDRAHERMNIIKVHCSQFMSKTFDYDRLRTAVNSLRKLQPSLIFLDSLEDICIEKAGDKRLMSWLKLLTDDLCRREPVMIVGATSRPEAFDASLRRPGRFDIEVEFPIPSPTDRKLILKQVLLLNDNCVEDGQIDALAESAHGFTGADLKHLCEMSRLEALEEEVSSLTYQQLTATLRRMKPSIMREITLERPNVKWSDIGGLHSLRHLLEETVVWPVKYPERFLHMGIEPPRGILMYGPPGCCKTMIGKALAAESGLNFFSIKGPELFSKWVGESERAIREMFRKARAAAPSILFFDEIDALASERGQSQSTVGDRVLAQMLTEIDGVEKLNQVVIVAATNRPDIVDKALLRPGRLDSMVYVPLPDLITRKEIFQIRLNKMRIRVESEAERSALLEELAQQSEGYTGAEVSAVCQRAGLIALGESFAADFVTREHFLKALERVRPRIGADTIAFYDKFANHCDELRALK